MNTAESTKTIAERHADELLCALKQATLLVAAYARLEQDAGRTSRHRALLIHLSRFGELTRRCEQRV
jgi:hypothetical protein